MYWMAGPAAVLIVAITMGVLVVANLRRGPTSMVPTSPASWRATAADSTTPDWFAALPFNCLGSTGLGIGPTPPLAYVDAVRTGTYAGYDRVTIQLTGGRPAGTGLSTQYSANFTQQDSGQTVTLKGQDGALVTLHPTDSHTRYRGPVDIKTGYPVVLELRKVQDYEGTVQWAIGLSQVPCYRMAFLDNPTRLVIDFRAGSATK